jgi:hypothetical protein
VVTIAGRRKPLARGTLLLIRAMALHIMSKRQVLDAINSGREA